MKMFLFFCLFIQILNYQYGCVDELEIDNACYMKNLNEEGKTAKIYYGGCSKGKMCFIDDEEGFCYELKNYKLEVGETCKINEECLSGICSGGECKSDKVPAGSECKNYDDCDYLSYCGDDKKCVASAQEGENCGDDGNPCGKGLACGKDKKCVKKYTQDKGTEASDGEACKSGRSHKFDGTDKYVCVDVTLEEDKCNEVGGDCSVKYSDGTKEESGMTYSCRNKPDGTRACKKLPGSEEWNNYIEKYTDKNNGLDKEDYEEITNMEWLDSDSILKAYVDFEYGTEIGDLDCIRDHYITITRGNGSYYSLSKLLVLLFALLF